MAGASESYHEPLDQLSPKTRDMHRALVSLQEELEAVDWYRQRADATADEELKGVLLHNMREEVEHACMVVEWLRRNSEDFAEQLQIYLFTDKPILEAEEAAEAGGAGAPVSTRAPGSAGDPGDGSQRNSPRNSGLRFTIGNLKGK